MKHLTAILFLSLAAATAAAQTSGSEKKESKAAEPAQPQSQGPSIQRSSNGVVVIRSSSASTQAARAKAAKDAEDAKKAEAKKAEEQAGAKKPSPAQKESAPQKDAASKTASKPKARDVQSYRYGPNGERVATSVTASELNSSSGSQSTQTIVGTEGRQVPFVTTKENVVTKSANHSVVERRVQRYDTQGQPMREAVVREEERKLPNGAVEKITTVFEQDVNGSLRPAGRTVSRETVTGNRTRTVVTTERPSATGAFETVEQRESLETKQGEGAGVVETVVSRPNVEGRLTEAKRERSVTQKSGATATTETQVWERSASTGETTLTQRTVGKLTERPDGSASETIQIYGQGAPGGGASDANAAGPRLQQTVQREVSVKPNGEKVETTTSQTRSVADPSKLGDRQVVQKVSRKTADGESVETHVSEQGVNGRMQPTQSSFEKVKK
jgi:hypothetical protein